MSPDQLPRFHQVIISGVRWGIVSPPLLPPIWVRINSTSGRWEGGGGAERVLAIQPYKQRDCRCPPGPTEMDRWSIWPGSGCAPYASQCILPFLPDELPNINLITYNGLRICLHTFIFARSSSPADWRYGVAQAKYSGAIKQLFRFQDWPGS